MSNRDDDGYNSPKETSEEVQRRKAALAQLTVDGGAAEENPNENGSPKPFDMKAFMEKEEEAEDFEAFKAKALTDLNEERPLEKFISYDGDGLKLHTKVETFNSFKSNALDFARYAQRYLETIQGTTIHVEEVPDTKKAGTTCLSYWSPSAFPKRKYTILQYTLQESREWPVLCANKSKQTA